jgi:phosphate transport system permease protein
MKNKKHILIKVWSIVSGFLIFSILIGILGFIWINGSETLSYKFIFENPKGFPVGTEGGILPAIIGSIYFTIIAVVLAFVLAFSTSIYIVFYSKNEKRKNFIRLIISTMAGIPSIILGLFGYSFLVVHLNLGTVICTGGIILGIMIFPFVEVRFEKTFLEIKKELIESSYSMGVNKSYTILNLILPICFKDMISALSLGASFAMGATAPILFTGAVTYAPIPKDIFSPAMALPFHLYTLINEGISLKNAYGTALVMIIILLIMNIFPILFGIMKGEE